MPRISTSAITLRVTPYSETSQVARLLTPQAVISVLAKGITRPKSQFQGPFDVLQIVEIEYVERNGHDPLHILTRARLSEWFGTLHRSLPHMLAGEALREILLAIPTPEQDAAATFTIARDALRELNAVGARHVAPECAGEASLAPTATLARAMAALLKLHGLTPELKRCVVTERAASGKVPVTFSYREFGLLSPEAAKGQPDTITLSPEVLKILQMIFATEEGSDDFAGGAWPRAFTVCARLVELAVGRRFNAPDMLLTEERFLHRKGAKNAKEERTSPQRHKDTKSVRI